MRQEPLNADDLTTGWNLEHTYARLPDVLFARAAPATFANPRVVIVNFELAESLGIGLEESPESALARLFSGQRLPPNAEPLAQAYAGHQFGGFTMLGDGRALLLGEQRAATGELFDIQFKGAGATPFSRRGDGLAALGPMLREYIISEAMFALGIPTTRSLAVVATGEPVYREAKLDGAILTRVAASHIRVGTFQFLAAKQDTASLESLTNYTIARHFPDLRDSPNAALGLLRAVMLRQADLVARWQLVGFIHGVMNTDNMSVCGETIDYGPCAFMDAYDPETVFSSIDHGGRYAYGRQPSIAQWNLARFAETLLPLIHNEQDTAIQLATELLNEYPAAFEQAWFAGMAKKLGLEANADSTGLPAADRELIEELLEWMSAESADFTNTFDDLACDNCDGDHYQASRFQAWRSRWIDRVECGGRSLAASRASMCEANPAIIPRNHRVEEALAAATEGDLTLFRRLLAVLKTPYDRNEESGRYRTPPPPGLCYKTFCGT